MQEKKKQTEHNYVVTFLWSVISYVIEVSVVAENKTAVHPTLKSVSNSKYSQCNTCNTDKKKTKKNKR